MAMAFEDSGSSSAKDSASLEVIAKKAGYADMRE